MLLSGHSEEAFLILHGGAGPQDLSRSGLDEATAALCAIARQTLAAYAENASALDLVVRALMGMESDERFNAGYGSALQVDGAIRVTAALMDGNRQSFSGVIGLCYARHPSLVAQALQGRSSRVLASPGNELLARQLGLPVESLVTPKRLQSFSASAAEKGGLCDTVGAVVLTPQKHLAAGTSTGGRGSEFPGRVSDAASVAGNYASAVCAVSATGIGEEIIDDALAARLETRVRDGAPLRKASEMCFAEAEARGRKYGWIAAANDGYWALAHTTPSMSFVVMSFSGMVLAQSAP